MERMRRCVSSCSCWLPIISAISRPPDLSQSSTTDAHEPSAPVLPGVSNYDVSSYQPEQIHTSPIMVLDSDGYATGQTLNPGDYLVNTTGETIPFTLPGGEGGPGIASPNLGYGGAVRGSVDSGREDLVFAQQGGVLANHRRRPGGVPIHTSAGTGQVHDSRLVSTNREGQKGGSGDLPSASANFGSSGTGSSDTPEQHRTTGTSEGDPSATIGS